MNKKVVAIVLVIALALTSAFAASTSGTAKKDSLAVGLNLGTTTGATVKYGMGKYDFQGTLGFGLLSKGLDVEAGAYYDFYDITFKTGSNALEKAASKTQTICCVAGPMASLSVNADGVKISALGVVGMEYTFSKLPLSLYLRAGLGYGIGFGDKESGIAGTGALGGVYTF